MTEPEKKLSVETRQESSRPRYEKPRIQPMSEQEILNTFQITRAMETWWTTGC